MPSGKWVVFDTSIYIAAMRAGRTSLFARALEDKRPKTYLSAVVSAELRAGAIDEGARRLVHDYTLWAHRVGRVVTPTVASWERAGDVLGRLRMRQPGIRSKLPALWRDLLIALSARQVGATVVAENVQDFELLRRYAPFDLAPLSATG